MDSNKDKVIRRLQQLGISPKRSLGQNFLIGQTVIDRIIGRVKHLKPLSLVEVGPGLGALTTELIKLQLPLMVIELDRVFAQEWRGQGLVVKEGDALVMNWREWNLDSVCLVSNLPYQISSSLVIDRSIDPCGVSSMVLMFQKEVAQRIMSQPKTKSYGLLTVIAQTFWDIDFLLEAGPNEFYPPPQVASRVLCFKRKESVQPLGERYLHFVKAGFSQRRKLLLSNLEPVYKESQSNRAAWEVQLAARGYSSTVRAEEVSVQNWIELYRHFYEK